MTPSQQEILLHTLGQDRPARQLPARNYFNADVAGIYFADCCVLESMGLMRQGKKAGGSVYFHATAEGVQRVVGLQVPREAIEQWLETREWPQGKRRRYS